MLPRQTAFGTLGGPLVLEQGLVGRVQLLGLLAVLAAMAWGAVKILRARDQQTALPRPVPSSQRGR